jgi:hypothetical protein
MLDIETPTDVSPSAGEEVSQAEFNGPGSINHEPEQQIPLTPEQITELIGKICAAGRQTIASINERGDLLDKLRQGMSYPEWRAQFGKNGPLQMSENMAYDLMRVARHPVISDPKHALVLPTSWYTLKLLTRITDADRFEELIADGSIHPELQRKDVETLLDREASRTRTEGKAARRRRSKSVRGQKGSFKRHTHSQRQAGSVDEVLRDMEPVLVDKLPEWVSELVAGQEEIRDSDHYKRKVRSMSDQLLTASDRLRDILKDDPDVVLVPDVSDYEDA